jgi:dihydroorotate dehydrogenase
MTLSQRLLSSSARLARPGHGLAQPQWRQLQRQSQRQLSLQSRTINREAPLRNALNTQKRYTSSTAKDIKSGGTRAKNLIYGTGLLVALSFGYLYITDTRASIHQWFVVPTMRLIHWDAEDAHHAGVNYMKVLYKLGLHIRERSTDDQELGDLRVEVFGHTLDNPVGTSAGIDKDAEVPDPLFALGPAIVEVGGVTPLAQEGNPKPRVFRLPSQNALINRYGLNSEGADHVAMHLRQRVREFAYNYGLGLGPDGETTVLNGEADVPPGSLMPGRLLAVQIAKNKTTPDGDIQAIANDYVYCVDRLAKYADIMVVNVSSPNTPGLRDLQATAPLTAILTAVVTAAKKADRKTPPAVMVKVSPDEESDAQIEGICSAVWASGVDGVIVGNTTKKRPDPIPKGYIMPSKEEKILTEMGGYSGPQMFDRTLALVKRYRAGLDHGPPEENTSNESQKTESAPVKEQTPAEASVQRDAQHLKPQTPEAEAASKQPLIKLPENPLSSSAAHGKASEAASSEPSSSPLEAVKKAVGSGSSSSSSGSDAQKVIFATGGITNGEQCLQILNAGASVCQVYTAMMYGGVGTITRIKSEMREEMNKSKRS